MNDALLCRGGFRARDSRGEHGVSSCRVLCGVVLVVYLCVWPVSLLAGVVSEHETRAESAALSPHPPMMIVYPRETPPHTRTARTQPPAAHRRRHSRPHHKRRTQSHTHPKSHTTTLYPTSHMNDVLRCRDGLRARDSRRERGAPGAPEEARVGRRRLRSDARVAACASDVRYAYLLNTRIVEQITVFYSY